MSNYLQAYISANSKAQAESILSLLLKKRLVAGGMITKGPASYWWNDKITEALYYNISAFTKEKNKKKIIESTKELSTDEAPLIWFVMIEGNKEMLNWIESNIS